MSDSPHDFKNMKATYHLLYDENGKLWPLKSYVNKKGQKMYYMERPQPAKTPSGPDCSFHVYEIVRGFNHDTKRCKFCNQEEEK